MNIQGATALVTGANRGLGRHLAQQLRDRGANVYAGARNPGSVDLSGVTPVQLDIADPASVTAATATAKGVSILVNNAGIETGATLLNGDLLGTGGVGGIAGATGPGLGLSDSEGLALIDRAVGEGFKVLDTADVYTGGNGERVVGTWNRAHPAAGILIQTNPASPRTGRTFH